MYLTSLRIKQSNSCSKILPFSKKNLISILQPPRNISETLILTINLYKEYLIFVPPQFIRFLESINSPVSSCLLSISESVVSLSAQSRDAENSRQE